MQQNPESIPTPQPPAPAPPAEAAAGGNPPIPSPTLEPTRYGDWEKNGRCIDF